MAHPAKQLIHSRAELRAHGMTARQITDAVRNGRLLRLRRDHYAPPDIDAELAEAVRIGGRVSCLTLLRMLGVFILTRGGLHVRMTRDASRRRHPRRTSTVLHWADDIDAGGTAHSVSIVDAVRDAVRCQAPRAAVATLDSVLHLGLLRPSQVEHLLRNLPRRFHVLIPLIDGRAESGPETFMRLILRAMGVPFALQVRIPDVGRVDFVVDGWLIIECDSREFHEGWAPQAEDRRRDIAAAARGYVTIRLLAAQIMDRPDLVRDQVSSVLGAFGARLRRS